jgi:kynurenine formamidase
LDLSVNSTDKQINLSIYRKPTHVDITIHFTSNHPHLQKLAAFNYFIQRLNCLPISHKAKEQEWKQILTIAHNNGFPTHIIQEIKKKQDIHKNQPIHAQANNSTPTQNLGQILLPQPSSAQSNQSVQEHKCKNCF